jgi:tetratricopeptide (TPR) repeat protein
MDPEYHRLRAAFHQARGEYRLAYDAHMSILALSGRFDDAFLREAGFLARYAGLYEKAVEILSPLAKSYPEDARVQMELGLALWFTGKTAEGLQAVQKVNTPLARIWEAYLTLQPSGNPQAAERILSGVDPEKCEPDERLFYLDVQAQILKAKKDSAGAAATLEKALPLARNEEERGALQLSIEALRKETKPPKPSNP